MPLINHLSWRDRASRFHLINPSRMGKTRDHTVDLNTERLAIPASLKCYSNQTYRRIQEPVPRASGVVECPRVSEFASPWKH